MEKSCWNCQHFEILILGDRIILEGQQLDEIEHDVICLQQQEIFYDEELSVEKIAEQCPEYQEYKPTTT